MLLCRGQREVKNQGSFEGVYTLQDLDVPDVNRIREVSRFDAAKFASEVGSDPPSSSDQPADHLHYALWSCSQLFGSR